MNEFSDNVREFVGKHPPDEPLLPLTHVTNMAGFRSVVTGYSLEPQECKVFGQNLLYFFYGRPSYRSTQSASTKLSWNVPVAFIVKPEAIRGIRSIFPFDSGAFSAGMYGQTFDARSQIGDFDLGTDLQVASRYVGAFHGGNQEYFRGKTDVRNDFGNFEFELQGLQSLAMLPGIQTPSAGPSPDERASAIEVISTESMTIGDNILGMIVPEHLLTDRIFLAATARWRLADNQIIPYVSVVGPGSEAWVGQFYQKVYELYQSNGYL